MSGLEWLAVPPILESGVKAIFKAYMLNKAALETFEDAAKAVSDLEICHLRLVFWLIASGMVSSQAAVTTQSPTRPPPHTDQQTVQRLYAMVLSKIQADFAELQTIFTAHKFPTTISEASVAGTDIARPAAPPAWTVDSIKAIQGRMIAKLKEDLSYRRKLKFQIQDKKRVDEVLSRLSRYLDMLISMLPAAERLQWDVEDRNYTMNKIAHKTVDELLLLVREASMQGDDAHATCYSTVATFKQAKEEYSHHIDAQRGLLPARPYSSFLKDATLQLEQSPNSQPTTRQLGTLTMPNMEVRPVMVEILRKKDRGGLVLAQQAEVNLLCALLSGSSPDIHPDLRVLQCLGHLSHPTDTNYFALIFALPPRADIVMPVTLHDILSVKRSTPEQLPTLESRRGLSLRIAKAVWRLHHYGWFHKGLTSSNILFFPPASGGEPDLQTDFFLAGFDNMRLQTSLNLTNTASAADTASRANFYRHPAFFGGVTDFYVEDGYAPAFDLWSLGVILCEISMWTPVDSGKFIRGRENAYTPAQMARVFRAQKGDDMYKHSPVSELAHRMGTQYLTAVVNCFTAEGKAKKPRWIAENIVRPLVQTSNEQVNG